jgi:hypothetical protein
MSPVTTLVGVKENANGLTAGSVPDYHTKGAEMDRTSTMPMVDDDSEVQGFTLGPLWDAFTTGIAIGRGREALKEQADYLAAHPPSTIIGNVGTPQPM